MLFTANGSLSIACPSVLFLPAGDTTLLEGTVTLTLKRNVERLSDMHVTFYGRAILNATSESFDTYRRILTLSSNDEKLEAGTHVFAFSFPVPGSTAPSEKIAEGSIKYHLEASVTGLGRLGFDLVETKNIYVVALAQGMREMPAALDVVISDYIPDLGTFTLNSWSPLPTIGGFTTGDLRWTGVRDPDIQTIESGVDVRQTIEIHSPSGSVKKLSPTSTAMFSVDKIDPSKSFAPTETGHPRCPPAEVSFEVGDIKDGFQSFSIVTKGIKVPPNVDILRIRWHNDLRPTTLPTSETPIRVSHELVYHCSWTRKDWASGKRALFSKAITLASCACMVDELTLPTYSSSGPLKKAKRKGVLCMCALSLHEVVEEQRAWIDWHARRMQAFLDGAEPHPADTTLRRVELPPKVEDADSSSSRSR